MAEYGGRSAQNAKRAAERDEKMRAWGAFRDEVRDKGMAILPQIVEKYGQTTLKQVSPGQFMGCCPFHVEKTPSFSVSGKGYYCYGAGCGAKGDVFSFLQERQGMSFREALETVAFEVGVPLPETGAPSAPRAPSTPPPPKDPADEFLAEPARLTPHDLTPAPRSLWVPRPGKFVRLFREEVKDYRTGEVTRAAGVKRYKPEMVHEYRTVNGELTMAVLRLRFNDGKKIFFSLCAREPLDGTPDELIRDGVSWQVRTGHEGRRPVYGAHRLREWMAAPNRGPIVLLEGEKCVDYAKRAFPEAGTLILSATGGFNASILADWKEITDVMALAGVLPEQVIVWPDADPVKEMHDGSRVDPQEIYAKRVFSGLLRDMKESFGPESDLSSIDFKRVIPPEGVEKGWDVADALDEGWTRERVESYIHSAAVPVDLSHMASIVPELGSVEPDSDQGMAPQG